MKKMLLIVLIMATVFTLAACQVTPEKPIVVKKDTERMVTQSADENNGTRLDDLAIPSGRYTFESTGADGKLLIKVGANIAKPDTDAMPILRAAIGGFTQEMVTGVFNYLFPDEKPLNRSEVPAKAEIEKTILNMQKKLADGSYAENGFSEEEYRDSISNMQAEYDAASEEVPEPSMSDGTMKKRFVQVGANLATGEAIMADFLTLDVFTEESFLSVITPDPAMDIAKAAGFGSHLNYWDTSAPNYTTLGMVRTDGTNLPDIAAGKLTISYDAAKALCDGFFAAASIADDFCAGAAFVVDDRGTGFVDGKWVNGVYVEGPKDPAKNYAYQFYYTRKASGIPVAVNTTNGGSSGEGFSFPWAYEFISFIVDNNGITQIHWSEPISAGETVQENTVLKPFDDIIKIFETMIKVTYETFVETEGKMEVNVDDVQLCLIRIREQNGDPSTGLLVPAWIFYGHSVRVDQYNVAAYDLIGGAKSGWSASSWPEAPIVLLAINAIDGSIIDFSKGY